MKTITYVSQECEKIEQLYRRTLSKLPSNEDCLFSQIFGEIERDSIDDKILLQMCGQFEEALDDTDLVEFVSSMEENKSDHELSFTA